MYSYQVRLRWSGGAEVHALTIASDIQVAPASLPVLTPGVNSVRYRAESAGPANVRVTFGYDTP
jgi:hypothetical protein